ncbi:MAG TPA: DHA2 family efflux MFS transporter permease subunit, partial [Methylomirabilota bacterium]|nr:DHA2 family efflux MFS transporter permease subunit [Methylomirabilota bacterium]
RWIFYINLPVGVLAVLMAHTFIEDPPYLQRSARRGIDYLGLGLMIVWLATLQIMLDKGQEEDWLAATWIRWFLAISTVAMTAFIIRELTTAQPIVNLQVLGDRNFALGTGLITIMGMTLYSTTALLPLFLQTLLGYSALQAGLAISPRGVGAMIAAAIVGRLVGVIDSRMLIAAGFGLLAFSSLTLSHLTLDVAQGNVVWATFLNGLATPMIFIPLSTTAVATLRLEQLGTATGIYNLMRNLGGSMGISAATTLLARRAQVHQARLVTHLTPYDPAFRNWLESVRRGLAARTGAVGAETRAMGVLYREVIKQATLLAFVDNFRLIGVLALCCLPLAFLFRRVRARPGAPGH